MKTSLTKGLEEDQKKELQNSFNAAYFFRNRLKKVLEEKILEEYNSMTSDENFKSPNWNLSQVDRLSRIKSYKTMIALIEEKRMGE